MTIEEGLVELSVAVKARIPEIYDCIRARLQYAYEGYSSTTRNSSLTTAESETVAASLRDVLEYIGQDRVGDVRASNETLREVQLAARAGVDLQHLLKGSRAAQAALWEFVLEEAHRTIPDPTQRSKVLRHASASHFAWNDKVTASIIETYQMETTSFSRQSQNRRKLSTLRALLAGLPIDSTVFSYNLSGRHLAAVVSGEGVESIARTLGSAARIRPLVITAEDETGYIWVEWSSRMPPPQEAVRGLTLPKGTRVSFGSVSEALEGFAVSHRQALESDLVAQKLGRQITWYDEVMLEALAMRDLAAVSAFISDELGDLGSHQDPPNRLVETLEAYFASGQNAASAASRLGVHSRTIAYRLKIIEGKIGSAGLLRDELPVAIRLSRMVDAMKLEPGAPADSPGLPLPAH
ncbi:MULTISPECIES: PucR family transcriptional regulator [Micrococcaceae]|uniref:PucR family transcriptional regulator n=1 Tax=Micrococcaceae TaxID=1268 RepID=UPI0012F24010|nr:helix-turn-helix domain-containing protein [Arthrobacter sp. 9V]VXB54390.1 CdaR family transcriptional regulator [Arthrobacter sp. 9V]